MSKVTRRRYTPEFKAEAVALVEKQGYKISEAARALGIHRKLLDRWLAKAREKPEPGATDSRDAELARLREGVTPGHPLSLNARRRRGSLLRARFHGRHGHSGTSTSLERPPRRGKLLQDIHFP